MVAQIVLRQIKHKVVNKTALVTKKTKNKAIFLEPIHPNWCRINSFNFVLQVKSLTHFQIDDFLSQLHFLN